MFIKKLMIQKTLFIWYYAKKKKSYKGIIVKNVFKFLCCINITVMLFMLSEPGLPFPISIFLDGDSTIIFKCSKLYYSF